MAISENLQQTCCRGCEEKRTSLHSWWGYKSVHPLGKEYESQSESRSVVSDSFQPHGLYSLWNSPGQNTGVGSHSLLQGDLPNPEIKPRSPTLQVDSLPAEPQGKSKNTGVGSLSLLQGIFRTQQLNWGLLHCRQIVYQLSYQGRPGDNPGLS